MSADPGVRTLPRLRSAAPRSPDPTGNLRRSVTGRSVELDFWRVLAALSIVVYHTWQTMRTTTAPLGDTVWWMTSMHGIETAVDVFFVISALVLVPPLVRNAIDAGPATDWKAFLRRRFFRVVPLYWTVCIAVWSYRNYSFNKGQWLDLVEHLFFLHQFDSKRIFFTVGPAWSLAVEVFFYLAIPLWIGGTVRLARSITSRRRRIAAFCVVPALAIAASAGFKEYGVLTHVPLTRWAWWFSFPARADVLAFGSLVAVWLGVRGPQRRVGALGTIALRLSGLGVLATLFWVHGHHLVWYHTVAGSGFALLLAAAVGGRPLISHRLGWLGVERLGRRFVSLAGITFSLYLSHEPLIVLLHNMGVTPTAPSRLVGNEIIAVFGAIALGYLVWALVEQPTYRLRWLPEMRRHTPGPHHKLAVAAPPPAPSLATAEGR